LTEFETLPIERLSGEGCAETGADARAFCLGVIQQVYGIAYHPDWHADLDSLALAAADSWFSNENRGAFFLVRNLQGQIMATGGLYDLARKPNTASRLAQRYGEGENVCQIVRVYLDASVRRMGLGSRIVRVLENEAKTLNYSAAYLHADAQTAGTLRFWRDSGYREFDRFSYPSPTGTDTSVDFDKLLA